MDSEYEIMEKWIILDVFLFLSSLRLFFGFGPSTTGVGTGLYCQSIHVEFCHAPDLPKGPD
jgi:hypothetical protein